MDVYNTNEKVVEYLTYTKGWKGGFPVNDRFAAIKFRDETTFKTRIDWATPNGKKKKK